MQARNFKGRAGYSLTDFCMATSSIIGRLYNRTETTTPQVKNLIGLVRIDKCVARAARTLEQSRAVLCKTTT